MKDCNHPKLQKIKKLSTVTIKCPDCKKYISFLSDRVHEIMKNMFLTDNKSKPISNNNEVGRLYGVPIFISKMDDEK